MSARKKLVIFQNLLNQPASNVNQRVTHYPPGVMTLFYAHLFAALSFGSIYSSLVLHCTAQFHFSANQAITIMGSFAALNSGLHMLGGYIGGRFFSFQALFVIGMLLQIIGCWVLATLSIAAFNLGLSFFLVGSGFYVTCINMMLTQLFRSHDKRRENAFLWNYSGMNIGTFIGFTIAGYYQLQKSLQQLFVIASIANITALLIIISSNALQSKLLKKAKPVKHQVATGFIVILLVIFCIMLFLNYATVANWLILLLGSSVFMLITVQCLRQPDIAVRHQLTAFIIFSLVSLIFWSIYQIAPIGLTLFLKNNVNRALFGFIMPPQWIQNINTLAIIIGAPILSHCYSKLRQQGKSLLLPLQMAAAMLLIGVGLLLLPLGIKFAAADGLINITWIYASYILQSVGEILISPLGYAIVGLLVPYKMQGLMMGTWMMMTGIAAIIASAISHMPLHGALSLEPAATNSGYQQILLYLGITGCLISLLLYVFRQQLCYLTKE